MNFDYSYWTRLPNELRAHVLKFLRERDAKSLAAVSPKFKKEVDNLYRYEVYTETLTVETCNSALKQRLGKLILNHSTTSHFANLVIPANPSTTFLKYPNMLRYMNIQTGNIHHTLYQALLEETSEYLVQLNVHLNSKEGIYISSCPRIRFKNLKRLDLIRSQPNNNIPIDHLGNLPLHALNNLNETNDMFLNIIRNIDPSSPLAHFNIRFDFKTIAAHHLAVFYTSAVFSLIIQHPESLKIVEFKYSNSFKKHRGLDDGILDKLPFHHPSRKPSPESLQHVKNVDKINVNMLSFNPKRPFPILIDLWKSLINGQTNLTSVSLLADRCNVVEEFYLETFIPNVQSIITKVDMKWSPINDEAPKAPLNMEIFEYCYNLRRLVLRERTNEVERREAINFDRLPTSLDTLIIASISLTTSEIRNYFASATELCKLKLDEVSDLGRNPRKGVTCSDIPVILRQPKLTRVRITEFNGGNEAERWRLRRIISKLDPVNDGEVLNLEKGLNWR